MLFTKKGLELEHGISATLLEFTLEENENLEVSSLPEYLNQAEKMLSTKDFQKLCLISGRGPVWLYASLIHLLHPTKAAGVFDPRVGYVVVTSHSSEFQVGQVFQE